MSPARAGRPPTRAPEADLRLIHETYALHFMLTNVGFEPSEVYVDAPMVANLDPPGRCAVMSVLRDGIRCSIPIWRLSDEEACDRYLDAWRLFAETKPKMAIKQLDRIVHGSVIFTRRVEILTLLVTKGFQLTGVKS